MTYFRLWWSALWNRYDHTPSNSQSQVRPAICSNSPPSVRVGAKRMTCRTHTQIWPHLTMTQLCSFSPSVATTGGHGTA
jgi:hypothetical protein